VTALGYTPAHGFVLRVEWASTDPINARPGDRLTLRARLVALAPHEETRLTMREAWTVLFAGLPLLSLPAREMMVPQGTSDVVRTFELPADAAEGEYAVEVAVRLLGEGEVGEAKSRAPFSVAGASAPQRDQPAASPVPPSARMIRVTVASVQVRTGPSPGARALARISRDAAVEVLEDRQSGRDRWYRVRLQNGDEGWIPATAVAPGSR
jgi:hypothetical protein